MPFLGWIGRFLCLWALKGFSIGPGTGTEAVQVIGLGSYRFLGPGPGRHGTGYRGTRREYRKGIFIG